MPEVEGLQLIQELLRLNPSQRIIAMSGAHRAESYLATAKLLGAKATFTKPLPRKSCCGPSTRSRIGNDCLAADGPCRNDRPYCQLLPESSNQRWHAATLSSIGHVNVLINGRYQYGCCLRYHAVRWGLVAGKSSQPPRQPFIH